MDEKVLQPAVPTPSWPPGDPRSTYPPHCCWMTLPPARVAPMLLSRSSATAEHCWRGEWCRADIPPPSSITAGIADDVIILRRRRGQSTGIWSQPSQALTETWRRGFPSDVCGRQQLLLQEAQRRCHEVGRRPQTGKGRRPMESPSHLGQPLRPEPRQRGPPCEPAPERSQGVGLDAR